MTVPIGLPRRFEPVPACAPRRRVRPPLSAAARSAGLEVRRRGGARGRGCAGNERRPAAGGAGGVPRRCRGGLRRGLAGGARSGCDRRGRADGARHPRSRRGARARRSRRCRGARAGSRTRRRGAAPRRCAGRADRVAARARRRCAACPGRPPRLAARPRGADGAHAARGRACAPARCRAAGDHCGETRTRAARGGRGGLLRAAQGPRHADRDPGAPLRVVETSVPGLATAGAGDVLSGVVGALLARGLGPADALSLGAAAHGAAAARAAEAVGTFTASDSSARSAPCSPDDPASRAGRRAGDRGERAAALAACSAAPSCGLSSRPTATDTAHCRAPARRCAGGARRLAVATLDEGLELRTAIGRPIPILVLGPLETGRRQRGAGPRALHLDAGRGAAARRGRVPRRGARQGRYREWGAGALARGRARARAVTRSGRAAGLELAGADVALRTPTHEDPTFTALQTAAFRRALRALPAVSSPSRELCGCAPTPGDALRCRTLRHRAVRRRAGRRGRQGGRARARVARDEHAWSR